MALDSPDNTSPDSEKLIIKPNAVNQASTRLKSRINRYL